MADLGYGERYRVVLASRGAVVGVFAAAQGVTEGLGLWLEDAKVEYGPETTGQKLSGLVFVPWTAVAYVSRAGED
jgi:hypothetical protein